MELLKLSSITVFKKKNKKIIMNNKPLFEVDNSHVLLLRCDVNTYLAYQGEPDLECLSSYVHHYGDYKQDIFVCLDIDNKRVYTNDIVSFKLNNLEYIALVVYEPKFRRYSLKSVNEHLPLLPLDDIQVKLIRSVYSLNDERKTL
jgi:hypothetical protein